MVSHLHKYKFESRSVQGHNHKIIGCTDVMMGISTFHFHYFSGISSYNNHTHYFSGYTGLPIKTENGHIHRIEGLLECNNQHEHKFKDYTFEEIEYNKRKLCIKAFI